MAVQIELPDGQKKEFPDGVTPLEVARAIGEKLARETVAARVNGKLIDATVPLAEDARLELVTLSSPMGLDVFRHSAAHLMAHAVKDLYCD